MVQEIPKIFPDLASKVNVDRCFEDCSELDDLIDNAFDSGKQLVSVEETFKNCIKLRGNPADVCENLWYSYKNHDIPHDKCFVGCTALDGNQIPISWGGKLSDLSVSLLDIKEHLETAADITKEAIDRWNNTPQLDATGMIPNRYLPSYVDDVIEGTLSADGKTWNFDSNTVGNKTPETGKIYIDINSKVTYRWSGTQFVEISKSLALGETEMAAFPGNRGKQAEQNITTLSSKITNVTENVSKNTDNISILTNKLSTVESGAQVNKLESIKVNGNKLNIDAYKSVNIDLSNYAKTADLPKVAKSGSYTDLTNKPTIPTTVAQLTDASNYIKTTNIGTYAQENFTTELKTKLTGIAAGAQVNVIEKVKVNGTALTITDKSVNIDLSKKADLVNGKVPAAQLPAEFKNQDLNIVSITDYGASTSGTGATNLTAITNALNALTNAGGGVLFVPAGEFKIAKPPHVGPDSAPTGSVYYLDIPSNVQICGVGKASILRFDIENIGNSKADTFLHFENNSNNITIKDLTIRGGLFKDAYYTDTYPKSTVLSSKTPWQDGAGKNLDALNNYLNLPTNVKWNGNDWLAGWQWRAPHAIGGSNIHNVLIDNLNLENCRYMGISFVECENIKVTNCTFSHILRDGVHLKNCKNSIITNNHFYRVLDDAVAIHTMDDSLAKSWSILGKTDIKGTTQIVSNNTFISCQGIKMLGGRNIIINDNIFQRSLRHAICFHNNDDGEEGHTNIYNISISNNIILDTLAHYDPTYNGAITFKIARIKTLNAPDNIFSSYYQELDGVSDTGSKIDTVFGFGAQNISIKGNKIGWTFNKNQGQKFYDLCKDYFFDLGYPNTYGVNETGIIKFRNPELPPDFFNTRGIFIYGSTCNFNIIENTFFGGGNIGDRSNVRIFK
jgi:parallel beta-helix repeat protein